MEIKVKIVEGSVGTKKSVLDAIHDFARAHGSKFTIEMEYSNWIVKSTGTYSNRQYSVGYFALLFFIDSVIPPEVAYTRPGHEGEWFNIRIMDENEFLKYIS